MDVVNVNLAIVEKFVNLNNAKMNVLLKENAMKMENVSVKKGGEVMIVLQDIVLIIVTETEFAQRKEYVNVKMTGLE